MGAKRTEPLGINLPYLPQKKMRRNRSTLVRYSLNAVLVDGVLQLEHVELPEHEHRPEGADATDAPPDAHRVVLRVRGALKHLQSDEAELDVADDTQHGTLLDVRYDTSAAGKQASSGEVWVQF